MLIFVIHKINFFLLKVNYITIEAMTIFCGYYNCPFSPLPRLLTYPISDVMPILLLLLVCRVVGTSCWIIINNLGYGKYRFLFIYLKIISFALQGETCESEPGKEAPPPKVCLCGLFFPFSFFLFFLLFKSSSLFYAIFHSLDETSLSS